MLKDEIHQNEEKEQENAREPLFKANDEQQVDELVEKELEKHELPDDDDKKSDEVEHQIKEQRNGSTPNDEMNGSTVEIIQPADLKPKNLGFTRTLLLAMFAAMIGTGAQFGYALGVMNAPSEVNLCPR